MPGTSTPKADVLPPAKRRRNKKVTFTSMMEAAKTANMSETALELPPAVIPKKVDKI